MTHLDVESERCHVLKSYPCRVRVQLGWWDGSGIVPAWIKKISRCGATLETGHQPPDFAGLWVRIDDGPSPEWTEARIIAVEEVSGFPWIGKTSYGIQVMFPGRQSDQLFRAIFDDLTRSAPDWQTSADAVHS
jgi:hypothetical protein